MILDLLELIAEYVIVNQEYGAVQRVFNIWTRPNIFFCFIERYFSKTRETKAEILAQLVETCQFDLAKVMSIRWKINFCSEQFIAPFICNVLCPDSRRATQHTLPFQWLSEQGYILDADMFHHVLTTSVREARNLFVSYLCRYAKQHKIIYAERYHKTLLCSANWDIYADVHTLVSKEIALEFLEDQINAHQFCELTNSGEALLFKHLLMIHNIWPLTQAELDTFASISKDTCPFHPKFPSFKIFQ